MCTTFEIHLFHSLDFLKDKEMQYRRVKIKGTFDHSKEVHLFPRSQNTDDKGGATRPSLPGAHIITPLSLSPLGYVILGKIGVSTM